MVGHGALATIQPLFASGQRGTIQRKPDPASAGMVQPQHDPASPSHGASRTRPSRLMPIDPRVTAPRRAHPRGEVRIPACS